MTVADVKFSYAIFAFSIILKVYFFLTHYTYQIRRCVLKLLCDQDISLQCKYFGFFNIISNNCLCSTVLSSRYTSTYFSLKLIFLSQGKFFYYILINLVSCVISSCCALLRKIRKQFLWHCILKPRCGLNHK